MTHIDLALTVLVLTILVCLVGVVWSHFTEPLDNDYTT